MLVRVMEFLAAIFAACLDPVILTGGLCVGYLFYAEMPKLAWGLLLFVLPGLPTLAAGNSHGLIFNAAAQFFAACLLTATCYRLLEFWRTRPRREA